ncbi:hypothetical protein LXE92_06620 [Burkholderia contaminans]|nr:hypothetical protein [Burkholderia contaminans]WFN11028.1 hypothetical protein LXE92_06620 [Burkholderia contaminans]
MRGPHDRQRDGHRRERDRDAPLDARGQHANERRDNGDGRRGGAHALPRALRADTEGAREFVQDALRRIQIEKRGEAAEKERDARGPVVHRSGLFVDADSLTSAPQARQYRFQRH